MKLSISSKHSDGSVINLCIRRFRVNGLCVSPVSSERIVDGFQWFQLHLNYLSSWVLFKLYFFLWFFFCLFCSYWRIYCCCLLFDLFNLENIKSETLPKISTLNYQILISKCRMNSTKILPVVPSLRYCPIVGLLCT